MQILDEYGNHKALFHVEEMSRGASKDKQAMLILLFRESQCWLLNWSISQNLHKFCVQHQEENIVHIVNHLHDNYGLESVTFYSCE